MPVLTRPRLEVLVADDRPDILEALRLLLKGAGYGAVTVDSPEAVLKAAGSRSFDLVLMDMNYSRDTTSGQEGLDLLGRLRSFEDPPPIIVMTAWGSVDLAVEAMRQGASDFIQKPWDNARLLATLEKQARTAAAKIESRRRAQSEIEIARHVQQKLFPHGMKSLASLQYAGGCLPAREVGGDYYDFLDLGPGKLGFLVADVSGKGIPAALLMANLQGCFRAHSPEALLRPVPLLEEVNRLFYDSTPPEHFATLFFGLYDDAARQFRYVNCGHEPALRLRPDGGLERLEATATILGMFRHWEAEEACIQLSSGELLVLVSDGVTEAGLDHGPAFGEARLHSVLRTCLAGPAQGTLDCLFREVQEYSAGPPADDVTVVALKGT